MPDFAPDVTPRYKVQYLSARRTHTALLRVARGTAFGDVENSGKTFFNGVFSAMAGNLPSDLAFLSAEVALTDSDIFLPAAVPPGVIGLVPLASFSKMDTITTTHFAGRGVAQGARVGLFIFGTIYQIQSTSGTTAVDFVLTPGENSAVDGAIAFLRAQPYVRAIDNSAPVWRSDATIKVNDHWLRAVRRGL